MSVDLSPVTANFLARRQAEDPEVWGDLALSDRRGGPSLSWRGVVPLQETPLVNGRGDASGYVLASTDERLPPFLEYAAEGPSLTQALLNQLREPMRAAGIDADPQRFVFVTSSEIYAEYEGGASGRRLVRLPDLVAIPHDRMEVGERDPGRVFDGAMMSGLWADARAGDSRTGPDVSLPYRPVLYNQGCNRYSDVCKVDLETSRSACAPNRIAGCVAVGWAMLLSAWKRLGQAGTQGIWAGSSCWSQDWATGMPPERCDDVNASIWRLHGMLNTGADGNTGWDDLWRGSAIFGEFGANFGWGRRDNPDFAFCCSIIQARQPFLWRATGAWGIRSGPPGAGHAVCAFGYNSATRSLQIGLGWGEDYPHKYISVDQFREHACFFVTRVRADQAESDEPMRFHDQG